MAAASTESLLPSPTKNPTHTCKTLTLVLTSITIVCLLTAFIIAFKSPKEISVSDFSIDLCSKSPYPISCHAIVSDAFLATANPKPDPVLVFHAILQRSLNQLDIAATTAATVGRRTDEPRHMPAALADCVQLLDLSRDRIRSSAAAASGGAYVDARAWMSAVLTNHDTCLDGLGGRGAAETSMEIHLQSLKSLASASLAVLNAVSGRDDYLVKPVTADFPAWVPLRDRKLLEAMSAEAIQANAVVAMDGSGNFTTVQAAVDAVPDRNKNRYVIYVKKGVYKENVSLGKKKTNVMIVGDGMNATVITGNFNVVDGATTFNSATLAAVGDGLILQDLKIENTAGPEKHQAVALRVGADQSVINRCRLDGYQDTLYAHSLRQFYRDTTVSGTVDFVFGNAAAVLQKCTLVARRPMDKQKNVLTAQGRTDPNQNTATSIQDCQVVPSPDLAPVVASFPTYLGRPWKEYSRTVYMQSFLDGHIHPKGWLEWSGDFALTTLFYGEYQNQGPGAGTAGRVNWTGYHVITDSREAEQFTVAALIQGGSWLTGSGVAFTEGL